MQALLQLVMWLVTLKPLDGYRTQIFAAFGGLVVAYQLLIGGLELQTLLSLLGLSGFGAVSSLRAALSKVAGAK